METKKSKAPKTEKKSVAKNLKEFFIDCLKDIYWAENALVKTLPKMFDQATNQKLKTAISQGHFFGN